MKIALDKKFLAEQFAPTQTVETRGLAGVETWAVLGGNSPRPARQTLINNRYEVLAVFAPARARTIGQSAQNREFARCIRALLLS